jgi:hypothetical protein
LEHPHLLVAHEDRLLNIIVVGARAAEQRLGALLPADIAIAEDFLKLVVGRLREGGRRLIPL